MSYNALHGLEPLENILGSREGNFADVLAFAAHRAEMAVEHDSGTDSTRPTWPAPGSGADEDLDEESCAPTQRLPRA